MGFWLRKWLFGVVVIGIFGVWPVSALEFGQKYLQAGKASLSERGYLLARTLGQGNFSPEMAIPIQITYLSWSDAAGIFGEKWRSPQLESGVEATDGGMEWTTPWGERIKFQISAVKDSGGSRLYQAKRQSGSAYFAPLADWVADPTTSDNSWRISGFGDNRGWFFEYRAGNLAVVTAPSGRSLAFRYDDAGRPLAVEQDGVAFVALKYNASGLVESMRINAVETTFGYTELATSILPETAVGGVRQVPCQYLTRLACGSLNPVSYGYSEYGYLIDIAQGDFHESIEVEQETAEERIANLLAPDKAEKVSGRIRSDGFLKYSYDNPRPGHAVLTNNNGTKAYYAYNLKTGDLNIADFNGKKLTISYFMRFDVAYMGKIQRITDGKNLVLASYIYDDATGKIKVMRDKLRNETLFSYDKDGNMVERARRPYGSREAEVVSRCAYNDRRLPVHIANLDENGVELTSVNIEYDAFGQPVKINDGRGETVISYNAFGYPVEIMNSFGQRTVNEYDGWNNLISSVDDFGVTTALERDIHGLPVKVTRRDGAELLTQLEIFYDGNGQPVRYKDQDGDEKKIKRDKFGRVTAEEFPDNTTVEYSYNELGQLAAVMDQNRNPIVFDWKRSGIGSRATGADQVTDYLYNQYGLIEAVNSHFAGRDAMDRSMKYDYDFYDRVVKVTYGDGEIETLSYDQYGRIKSATRGTHRVEYKYDFFGNMTEKNEDGAITRCVYNPYGQRLSRTVSTPDGRQLSESREYDKFGRLISQADGNGTVKYFYNGRNQLERQEVNGHVIDFTYTKYGQLESKTLREANVK